MSRKSCTFCCIKLVVICLVLKQRVGGGVECAGVLDPKYLQLSTHKLLSQDFSDAYHSV